MLFTRLRGTSTGAQKSKPKEAVSKVKAWLWPQSTEGRSARLTQFKDIGIFVGAVVLVWLLEDSLREMMEISPDELRKLGM